MTDTHALEFVTADGTDAVDATYPTYTHCIHALMDACDEINAGDGRTVWYSAPDDDDRGTVYDVNSGEVVYRYHITEEEE